MNKEDKNIINFKLVVGAEGEGLYLNDYRIAGHKPYGIGHTIAEFNVSIDEIKKALENTGQKDFIPRFL